MAALVLLTWALEPVMNTVLLCSSYARNLLTPATKRATYAFLAYTVVALASVTVGIVVGSGPALVLALGLALWAVSAGQVHLAEPSRRRLALGLHGAGALLAVLASAAVALDASPAAALSAALVATGVAMIWFTALT